MKIIRMTGQKNLHIHKDRFSVYDGDIRLFCFKVQTPVHMVGQTDEDSSIEMESMTENTVIWSACSTLWSSKKYRLSVEQDCFCFRVQVTGSGRIADISYFRGELSSAGSPLNVAGYEVIDMMDGDRVRAGCTILAEKAVITPRRATPPPFVFPFWNDYTDAWIGIGIAAESGAHNFERFELHAPRNISGEPGCWFTLPMEGYTEVDGEWTTPELWCGFADSDMDVLHRYAEWQYRDKGYDRAAGEIPGWWKLPIFCGWGEQCNQLPVYDDARVKSLARQDLYEGFADRLDKLHLPVGTIIIDDKWQKEYATLVPDPKKWRSLRGFCDQQHQKGRHVVMWFKSWDPEGLPEDECILVGGKPFCADSTNPKYLQRLRASIHKLFSSEEKAVMTQTG